MSSETMDLRLPFSPLHTVGLYDGVRQPTEEGYLQERMDVDELPWVWYASGGKCVRAFFSSRPLRVVVGRSGAFDMPGEQYLVHDVTRIWAMDRDAFERKYHPVVVAC